MKIDLDHLHFWMCAIRDSENPKRTLDAFWRGQIRSKEWLISELMKVHHNTIDKQSITIYGGWVGVLASMLFQSDLNISHITNVDIDPSCESVAIMMNQLEVQNGMFTAVTQDMCTFNSLSDIIINTSCEHISQSQYDIWLNNLSDNSLIVLQSNNYEIDEHVRIAENLEMFKTQSNINVMYAGELQLPLYTRYMLIGKKNGSS